MAGKFKWSSLLLAAPLVLALGATLAGVDGRKIAPLSQGFVLHGDTSVPDARLIKQYKGKIPGTILLDKLAKKLPPVPYNHKQHLDLKVARCGNCHHQDVQAIKPCSSCHTEAPADPKAPVYLKAFHGLCVECHKAVKAKKGLGDGDKPPDKKCYDCHIKKEGG